MSQNWYAVYTGPKKEGAAVRFLNKKGIENFCPLNYFALPNQKGRKAFCQPLFSSLVFIHCTGNEVLSVVRNIPGASNLVYWKSEPAVISNREIEAVKNITARYMEISCEKAPVRMGEEVSVIDGPVYNYNENSVSVKYQQVKITLPSLGFVLTAGKQRTFESQVIHQPFSQFSFLPRRLTALFAN
jgi:transcription antitermination factor NusG